MKRENTQEFKKNMVFWQEANGTQQNKTELHTVILLFMLTLK